MGMPQTEQVQRFESQLDMRIQHQGLTVEHAHQSIREEIVSWGADENVLAALNAAFENIRAKLDTVERLTRVHAIRTRRAPWYTGPDKNARNWIAYREHLIHKGWEGTVDSIDSSSTQVVSMLYNPGTPRFNARGLVLGYVQSGKTANMAAVIAKAADAGYKLVIILTGMIEKLRQQTQARMETDLTNQPDTSEWHLWTTVDEDFTQRTYPGFTFNPAHRHIMVIKKQKDVLQRIIDKLKNTSDLESNLPVLVIDDECDQASVNAPGKDNEWKTINRLIRQMMNRFPRHSYVGYTATPFANVLIDPSVDPGRPQDLYPKDFIYSLPRPPNYFGAERLFGRDLLDAEIDLADDEELDVIRTIPLEEIAHLRPTSENPDFVMTDSAEAALDYYLLATAVRDWRGQRGKHSTMLIHTSHLQDDHRLIAQGVEKALKARHEKLKKGSPSYLKKLEKLWGEEAEKVPPSLYGHGTPKFSELTESLLDATASSIVVIENSSSPTDERLDYDNAPEGTGRRYICVGGNVVSRGLTLEGLVSTFFMRTSRQYDTLMQMGRWFGYRPGYEDLPRVWMTVEMQANFSALATVEADIREKIRVYEQEEPDITPIDIAVRIRQIPGLAITAKNKMHAARRCRFSFAGDHRQTTHYSHKNKDILDGNWRASEQLIKAAIQYSHIESNSIGKLIRDVDRSFIEQFLHSYHIHATHAELVDAPSNRNHLLEYINIRKQQDPEALRRWNIGVVQPNTGKTASRATAQLDGIGKITLVTRSLFQELPNGDADIKSMMSRRDITIDMTHKFDAGDSWEGIKAKRTKEPAGDQPLLLLYPIDKDSQPVSRHVHRDGKLIEPKRSGLDAALHVMGIGIVFPRNESETEASNYVEVILPALEDAEDDSVPEEHRL
jgi:hypothetical protein